jgi:hypothetical protein
MDFDRILTVLTVWHDTRDVPNLREIHDAAMAELIEHQVRAKEVVAEVDPQPDLPLEEGFRR